MSCPGDYEAWRGGEWTVPSPPVLGPLLPDALHSPRPPCKYPGSKARMAGLIAELVPRTRAYFEPFLGSGIVLLHRRPVALEVVNDQCSDVTNLFRVLRSAADRERLVEQIALTPYAREEYDDCWTGSAGDVDPVEQARRFLVIVWMGMGSRQLVTRGWARDIGKGESLRNHAHTWMRIPDRIAAVADRLRLAQIECSDAMALMSSYAYPWVSLYLDPPYPAKARRRRRERLYRHEMTEEDHMALLKQARSHPGPAVISSYENAIYSSALRTWERLDLRGTSHGGARVEVIWRNPAAQALAPLHSLSQSARLSIDRLTAVQGELFAEVSA